MNIEKNKAIARRYVELWSTGNLDIAGEVLSEDFVDHMYPHQAPGPESVKQEVKAFREGFLDAQITLQGTHRGMFAGFPPTGKQVTLTGVDFMRIAAGKISVISMLLWLRSNIRCH